MMTSVIWNDTRTAYKFNTIDKTNRSEWFSRKNSITFRIVVVVATLFFQFLLFFFHLFNNYKFYWQIKYRWYEYMLYMPNTYGSACVGMCDKLRRIYQANAQLMSTHRKSMYTSREFILNDHFKVRIFYMFSSRDSVQMPWFAQW